MIKEDILIKVASDSEVKAVAGNIANFVKEEMQKEEPRDIIVSVIGAGAINQAIKSIIVAKGMLFSVNVGLHIDPRFNNLIIGGKEITSIEMKLLTKEI